MTSRLGARLGEVTHLDLALFRGREIRDSLPGPVKEAWDRVETCVGHDDPQARLKDMDAEGIAAEVIFAGGQNQEVMPFVGFGADAGPKGWSIELREVGERIWNRWLVDHVSAAPDRLIGVMQVPIWNVEAAVHEVKWGREAGLGAVNLPAPRSDFTPYNSEVYEPLWSTCTELGIPLVTHAAGGESPLGYDGPGGLAIWAMETRWMGRRHLWEMIFGGVFERHPELKVVFTEQGASWVPPTLVDLDRLYQTHNLGQQGGDSPGSHLPVGLVVLSKKPSEYWASNCYLSGSFLAPFETAMRHENGLSNLMWGRDYPHQEGTWPHSKVSMRNTFAGVPESESRQILGGRAVSVYNLNAKALRASPTTSVQPPKNWRSHLTRAKFRRTAASRSAPWTPGAHDVHPDHRPSSRYTAEHTQT